MEKWKKLRLQEYTKRRLFSGFGLCLFLSFLIFYLLIPVSYDQKAGSSSIGASSLFSWVSSSLSGVDATPGSVSQVDGDSQSGGDRNSTLQEPVFDNIWNMVRGSDSGKRNASEGSGIVKKGDLFGKGMVERKHEGNVSGGGVGGGSDSGENGITMKSLEKNAGEENSLPKIGDFGGKDNVLERSREGNRTGDVAVVGSDAKEVQQGVVHQKNVSLQGNKSGDVAFVGPDEKGVLQGNVHEKNVSTGVINVSSEEIIYQKVGLVGGNQTSSSGGNGMEAGVPLISLNGSVGSHKCDIFHGRWVRDTRKSYYPAGSCPYIDIDFNCHKNGRPDSEFLQWRWQPNGCSIPRLNAADFLERLRGKRLVFVGDSLNRNMWESLVCILRQSITNKRRVFEASGRNKFKAKGYYAIKFKDYNCSIDYVRSPFLVKEIYGNGVNGTVDEKLRLDLLDETASAYHEADVIVFNTGHWWTHEKTSRGIDYYQESNYVHPVLKVLEAYKRALTTWAKWVDKNINANKTQVVFRGYSPIHFSGGRWNSGGQCHKETEPIFNESFLGKYPSKMRMLERVLNQMHMPVTYLNITLLTDYRKDGHPSIYRMKYESVEAQIAAVTTQDCSHWCLPGIPDTWNELLYASLLLDGKGPWKN